MVSAMGLTVVLVLLTVLVHYETLRLTSHWLPKLTIPPRSRLLVVMAGAFVAHTVEVWLYAVALYLAAMHFGLGELKGDVDGTFQECLYFSTVSYTSLGLGDVYPGGSLRLVTGVEALNGLLMIAWSGSFTYLAMEELWGLHARPRERHAPREAEAQEERPRGQRSGRARRRFATRGSTT